MTLKTLKNGLWKVYKAIHSLDKELDNLKRKAKLQGLTTLEEFIENAKNKEVELCVSSINDAVIYFNDIEQFSEITDVPEKYKKKYDSIVLLINIAKKELIKLDPKVDEIEANETTPLSEDLKKFSKKITEILEDINKLI